MTDAYEHWLGEVRAALDAHPELWERPSREAVAFAVNLCGSGMTSQDLTLRQPTPSGTFLGLLPWHKDWKTPESLLA